MAMTIRKRAIIRKTSKNRAGCAGPPKSIPAGVISSSCAIVQRAAASRESAWRSNLDMHRTREFRSFRIGHLRSTRWKPRIAMTAAKSPTEYPFLIPGKSSYSQVIPMTFSGLERKLLTGAGARSRRWEMSPSGHRPWFWGVRITFTVKKGERPPILRPATPPPIQASERVRVLRL